MSETEIKKYEIQKVVLNRDSDSLTNFLEKELDKHLKLLETDPDKLYEYYPCYKENWTIAHEAAIFARISSYFKYWYLRNDKGVSVAMVAKKYNNLPNDFLRKSLLK